ncbi:MAG: RIP metalloprotease RseP [Candidatus Cloacimonetes bacterium]|nr:RIP metalloprotease RseP [Candidatus Cloacimonadota bacterium]
MLTILGALITFGILILVHEFGHFLAARKFGVEIEKFSIGFGPKLISFKHNNTEFRLSALPLGGYVKMRGENPDENVYDEASYRSKSWWQRAVISFAGPFSNLLFALMVMILSFAVGRQYTDSLPIIGRINNQYLSDLAPEDIIIRLNDQEISYWSQLYQSTRTEEPNLLVVQRHDQVLNFDLPPLSPEIWMTEVLPRIPAIIGDVSVGMPAYNAGLKTGDEILSVNGQEVADWYQMRELIAREGQSEVVLRIKRGEQIFEKVLPLEDNVLGDNKIIGISQYQTLIVKEKYSLLESLQYGTLSTVSFVALNYYAFYKLLTKPSALTSNLGGPVMLLSVSKQTLEKGLDTILTFIAALSLILMIMNLLPIPILDGGNIFFCFLEGISGKALPQKLQTVLQNIGFLLIISLMIFAFANDFSRIFKRNSSLYEQQVDRE